MSVLERCPSYRGLTKRSKGRQGPTLGVSFTHVFVLQRVNYKGVNKGRDQLSVSVLPRCSSYRFIEGQLKEVNKGRDQL